MIGRKVVSMSKKITNQEAIKFYEDNIIAISGLETASEKGCAEKCMDMLKNNKSEKKFDEKQLQDVYNIIMKIDKMFNENIIEPYGVLLMTEDHESLSTAAGILGNMLDPEYISEKAHLVITNDKTRKTLSEIYANAGFKSNMLTPDETEKDKAYKTIMSAAYMLKNLVASSNDAQKMLDSISTLTEVINQAVETLEDKELTELVKKINVDVSPLQDE